MEKPDLVGGKWLSDAKKPKTISHDRSLATKSNFTITTDEDDNSFTSASSASSFANTNVTVDYSDQRGLARTQQEPPRSRGTTSSAFSRVEPSTSRHNTDPNTDESRQIKSSTTRDKSTMREKKKHDRPRKLSQRNLANTRTASRRGEMGKFKPSPPADNNKTPIPIKEKSSDHARSTATTRTLSAGDLTFSSGTTSSRSSADPAHADREYDHERRTTRQPPYASRSQMTTAHQVPSVASSLGHSKGSSTWAPVDEMWGLAPSPTVEREHDSAGRKPSPSFGKQKSKRKKKHGKAKRSGTPSKREIIETVSPPPLSDRDEPTTKHVRKTQRRSQSERSITQESPNSVSSSEGLERRLSTRDEFRAFLIQDRESQRNLIPDRTKKSRSTSRRGFADPYASKTTKPSSKKEGKKERKRKKKYKAKSPTTMRASGTGVRTTKTRSSLHSRSVASVTPTEESERSQRLRLLNSKQASLSTIESGASRRASISPETTSPGLTAFFEWNRSPSEPRRRFHHAPSSRGTVDRRELLRKAQSTSDVNQFYLTPEWPAKTRNGRLHSMFYDLSLRRHAGPHAASKDASPGIPTVSARQMLSIMEPCSRREVMMAQGLELEPPLSGDDSLFNVGEILDNISLTSSQRTGMSSRQ